MPSQCFVQVMNALPPVFAGQDAALFGLRRTLTTDLDACDVHKIIAHVQFHVTNHIFQFDSTRSEHIVIFFCEACDVSLVPARTQATRQILVCLSINQPLGCSHGIHVFALCQFVPAKQRFACYLIFLVTFKQRV
jgi:hypothetical protein